MPWIRPTIQQITSRIEKGIESRLFGSVALLRRAVLRILARVFAGSIHTSYGFIDFVKDQVFVTTAEGEYLDRHGRLWGINRLPGSFAEGPVEFSGPSGTNIPADTRIQTDEGIEYGTVVAGVIGGGGTVILTAQAVESGDDGNIVFNPSIDFNFQLISPITGVDSNVLLTADMTGGEDSETDEEYRTRILQRIQSPPMGGTADDYIAWALEVSGVGRAWSYPLANGAGTVAVCVISDDILDPTPSVQLLSDVTGYIDTKKPVTASLFVESITDNYGADGYAEVLVSLYIVNSTDLDLRERIEDNLNQLFQPHKPGNNIKASQVKGAISASGVEDYAIDAIYVGYDFYDGSSDIVLSGYMYPKLTGVSFYEL